MKSLPDYAAAVMQNTPAASAPRRTSKHLYAGMAHIFMPAIPRGGHGHES
jgi:hypothetical protein